MFLYGRKLRFLEAQLKTSKCVKRLKQKSCFRNNWHFSALTQNNFAIVISDKKIYSGHFTRGSASEEAMVEGIDNNNNRIFVKTVLTQTTGIFFLQCLYFRNGKCEHQ